MDTKDYACYIKLILKSTVASLLQSNKELVQNV